MDVVFQRLFSNYSRVRFIFRCANLWVYIDVFKHLRKKASSDMIQALIEGVVLLFRYKDNKQ